MRDVEQLSKWAKKNMSELEYLQKENELLKENLEELKKRESANEKKNLWSGSISTFVIAIIAATSRFYKVLLNTNFWERFLYWNGFFIAFLVCFTFLFVILNSIIEELYKNLSLGFYKKDNEFHWQKLIPVMLYFIAILIITALGPQ